MVDALSLYPPYSLFAQHRKNRQIYWEDILLPQLDDSGATSDDDNW